MRRTKQAGSRRRIEGRDEERRAIRPWSVPAEEGQREAARYRVFAEDSSFRY